MMHNEFEKLVGDIVSVEDYEKIELVYSFYPSKDLLTKEKIVQLYKWFGIRIFDDMYNRAKKVSELEYQICEMRRQLKTL